MLDGLLQVIRHVFFAAAHAEFIILVQTCKITFKHLPVEISCVEHNTTLVVCFVDGRLRRLLLLLFLFFLGLFLALLLILVVEQAREFRIKFLLFLHLFFVNCFFDFYVGNGIR